MVHRFSPEMELRSKQVALRRLRYSRCTDSQVQVTLSIRITSLALTKKLVRNSKTSYRARNSFKCSQLLNRTLFHHLENRTSQLISSTQEIMSFITTKTTRTQTIMSIWAKTWCSLRENTYSTRRKITFTSSPILIGPITREENHSEIGAISTSRQLSSTNRKKNCLQ